MFNKTKMVWRIFFVRSSFKRVRFLSVIALSLILSCFTVAAETDDKRYRIQIEAGTADRSLIELAAQADRTLVYSFDDTKDIVVSQLAGRFTLVEGLQKLLAGTELAFSIERDGAIRVIRNSKSGVIDNMKKNNTRLGWFGGLLAILATASAHVRRRPEKRPFQFLLSMMKLSASKVLRVSRVLFTKALASPLRVVIVLVVLWFGGFKPQPPTVVTVNSDKWRFIMTTCQ